MSEVLRFETVSGGTLPPQRVKGFSLGSTIEEGLPVGEVFVDDYNGDIINNLSVAPGDYIIVKKIGMEGGNNDNIEEKFAAKYVISGIRSLDKGEAEGLLNYSLSQKETGVLSGIIRINFVHEWFFNLDFEDGIYTGKGNNIVMKILTAAKQRGVDIDIGDIETTGNGAFNQIYKVGKSDLDFIKEDVLKKFSVNNSYPLYFFVNEKNEAHYQSFQSLYNKEPKIVFVPPLTHPTGRPIKGEHINKLIENKKLKETFDVDWCVAKNYREIIKNMKRKFTYLLPLAVMKGDCIQIPKVVEKGYMLVNKNQLDNMQCTHKKVYFHKYGETLANESIYKLRKIIPFFEIIAYTRLAFGDVFTGDVVYFYTGSPSSEYASWANGKWVVAEIDHFQREDQLLSKVRLIKPMLDTDTKLYPPPLKSLLKVSVNITDL